MKASVIVITRNRVAYFPQALEKLVEQEFEKEAFEILVVDNNSNDSTALVVKDFIRHFGDQVQYVFEKEIGMSRARNKGASVAKGEILLFIDDDALASTRWIQNHCSLYEKYPGIVATGGRIDLLFGTERPRWLTDELLVVLGHLNTFAEESIMEFPDHPFGVNFSVKKKQFIEMGGFNNKMKNYNDEKAFFYKLHLNKQKVGYSPNAVVYHQVAPNRLEKKYFINRGIKQGIANITLTGIFNYHKIPSLGPKCLKILMDGIYIIRNLFVSNSRYSFEQLFYLSILLGEILGIIFWKLKKE